MNQEQVMFPVMFPRVANLLEKLGAGFRANEGISDSERISESGSSESESVNEEAVNRN